MGLLKAVCLIFFFVVLINAEDYELLCDASPPFVPDEIYCWLKRMTTFVSESATFKETGKELIHKYYSIIKPLLNQASFFSDVIYKLKDNMNFSEEKNRTYIAALSGYYNVLMNRYKLKRNNLKNSLGHVPYLSSSNAWMNKISLPLNDIIIALTKYIYGALLFKQSDFDMTIANKSCSRILLNISEKFDDIFFINCNLTASRQVNNNILFMKLVNFIASRSTEAITPVITGWNEAYDDLQNHLKYHFNRFDINMYEIVADFENEYKEETFENVNEGFNAFSLKISNYNGTRVTNCIPEYFQKKHDKTIRKQYLIDYLLVILAVISDLGVSCSAIMFPNDNNAMLDYARNIFFNVHETAHRLQREYPIH